MKLHLLLTAEIAPTKPPTCKTIYEYGDLLVMFNDGSQATGVHCVVEDTPHNIINWLTPFDDFIKGSGSPIFEQFEKISIKKILSV